MAAPLSSSCLRFTLNDIAMKAIKFKKYLLLLPLLFFAAVAMGQHAQARKVHIPQDSANLRRLQEINRDVWIPFSEAYAAGDAAKYIGLHTPDLVRATGGEVPEVKDLAAYRASSERHFQWNRENGRRVEIAFRFFERVAGPAIASERGTYRYTAIDEQGQRSDYYGRFHVFLQKVDGVWKIAVDYDSDEEGSIGAMDFEAGQGID